MEQKNKDRVLVWLSSVFRYVLMHDITTTEIVAYIQYKF